MRSFSNVILLVKWLKQLKTVYASGTWYEKMYDTKLKGEALKGFKIVKIALIGYWRHPVK